MHILVMKLSVSQFAKCTEVEATEVLTKKLFLLISHCYRYTM